MPRDYDRSFVEGASAAKSDATKRIRKAFKIKKSDISGTRPNERFECVLRLAKKKLKKARKKAREAEAKIAPGAAL